ncbi:hypothetical protein [Muricoccus radiodurans]|uniref:hypothetical protein n=1 Tax=Muricoccus radiodurans TaxID=2231721 RepID=UPI003CEA817C
MNTRLSRLEEGRGGVWRAWLGVPLDRWPDEALVGLICKDSGRPLPPPGADLVAWLPDAELEALIVTAREEGTPCSAH